MDLINNMGWENFQNSYRKLDCVIRLNQYIGACPSLDKEVELISEDAHQSLCCPLSSKVMLSNHCRKNMFEVDLSAVVMDSLKTVHSSPLSCL